MEFVGERERRVVVVVVCVCVCVRAYVRARARVMCRDGLALVEVFSVLCVFRCLLLGRVDL